MADNNLHKIENEEVKTVLKDSLAGNPHRMTLESLTLLVNAERLKFLHQKTHTEFAELKKRQKEVSTLHKLMKAINSATNSDGTFDCSSNKEIQQQLADAKSLGIDIKEGKFSYNAAERERLAQNIQMTIDDLNVQNDMQMQTVTNLNNERYESYQLARSIMKPLHEDKLNKARAIGGR